MDQQVSVETANEEATTGGEAQEEHQEPIRRSRGKTDAFADAFEAAEKDLKPAEKKPEPKSKAKEDPKPAEKQPERAREPRKAPSEGDDSAKEEKAAPETTEKLDDKPKGPLAAKEYWSKERKEAFKYQPREVQEAWLAESPVPHGHWPEEQKATFAKLPREAQEMMLLQAQSIERGYTDKFEKLAAERKLAEGIRGAIPEHIRGMMQQRGLDEVAMVGKLIGLLQHSMQDPVGYARNFIANNRIDPRQLFGEGAPQQGQPGAQPSQADIASHPAYRALVAEVTSLKQQVHSDLQHREEESSRQIDQEMDEVLSERDEAGNARYPYIRVLADTMAQILEDGSELYGSMGTREKIADAYHKALERFPELPRPTRTAKPAPVDEPVIEDADSDEEDAQAEKLKKAATKKSKTPHSAPASSSGDPFERAFARAQKQLGR